jgi:hypothetical protein
MIDLAHISISSTKLTIFHKNWCQFTNLFDESDYLSISHFNIVIAFELITKLINFMEANLKIIDKLIE